MARNGPGKHSDSRAAIQVGPWHGPAHNRPAHEHDREVDPKGVEIPNEQQRAGLSRPGSYELACPNSVAKVVTVRCTYSRM